ncbi:MAG: hypothetical protein PVJ86_11405 [Phycisphaerales bacterium]
MAEKQRKPLIILSKTTIALLREKLVILEPEAIEITNLYTAS